VLSALRAVGDLTSGPAGGFDLWNLIQFGLLGVGFACLAVRKFIVPEWVLRNAEERHARELAEERAKNALLQGQVEKLQTVYQESLIPALVRATEVAATYNEELARKRWQSPPGKDGAS
jgi:hypothetical protein